MQIAKLVAILSVAVVALVLIVSVYQDVQPGAAGRCENLTGSLCVADSCPGNLEEAPRYACFAEGWTCCVPRSDS